ncbi:hypothetical protein HL658_29235 [Azospirillum sp. RWY-5-1]|uniref:Lipocalin-like domain-containing protein n=1 Tax=Azospirillum oleiclasticum TaxID=2735135 RepID=A0ABX2TIT3_9PROT|nr:hypothetical protein [Azospirillum oleiclasticum]NYZ16649.1 hypothetical protein [Azospirillum oleiclasticum]NYZ24136.1 hypothetical protein [Azospirillum oleiclasticum]
MTTPPRHRRTALSAAAALLLLAGCETYDPGNPLIGSWTLTAPMGGGGLALGRYEFRRSSMRTLGVDVPVDYSVSGNTVTVVPESFGPILEVEVVDANLARLRDPLTGGLMTLRRLR